MKHFLSAAALLAAGLFAIPGAANATSLPDIASLSQPQSGASEHVDWRPFRHCHGRRWDRNCHGGKFFFGGDNNRGTGRDRRGNWDRGGRGDDDRRGDYRGGERSRY
jgi:hypothetical protein